LARSCRAITRCARLRAPLLQDDTHWAAPGCLVAYGLICERIGIAPEPELLSRNHQDHGAAMDLGMKLSPPVAEGFRIYDFTKNSVRTYANPIARYLDSATQNIANACRRACSVQERRGIRRK
jgi:hypothetical protein